MPGEVILYEDPRAMEAIRYYTDPLLPTFGNKTASATAAGISTSVFQRSAVKEEIKRITAERQEASRDVLMYLGTYTSDAARELVKQLSIGRELEFVRPEKILNEPVDYDEIERVVGDDPEKIEMIIEGIVAGKARRAEAMVKHNNTVISAAKERRAAAIEILRQQIGTPEQRVRVTRDNDPTPLADMSDEQLEELSSVVTGEMKQRKPREATVEDGPPEAEELEVEIL